MSHAEEMNDKLQEELRHQQRLAEEIVKHVQENPDADPNELAEKVLHIMHTPMPRELHEDTMGVSPDVIDPCGAFGSIEDLHWYMREYPDCFDDPRFFE